MQGETLKFEGTTVWRT